MRLRHPKQVVVYTRAGTWKFRAVVVFHSAICCDGDKDAPIETIMGPHGC